MAIVHGKLTKFTEVRLAMLTAAHLEGLRRVDQRDEGQESQHQGPMVNLMDVDGC